jgi:two-component system, OmpR family, response regulator
VQQNRLAVARHDPPTVGAAVSQRILRLVRDDVHDREEAGVQAARVLVVDDEEAIRDLVAIGLRYEGFEVTTAASGHSALEQAERFRPDLIVLDVMLPDLDGFEVSRRLQAAGARAPIVFLTARKAMEDKLTGLTIGGDDYVTKPFSLQELHARVRVVLRRTRPATVEAARLRAADVELDDEAHEAWRAGRRLELTPTEFRLLRYLAANAGRVLSKAQILDHVWDYSFDGSGAIVETYVYYLRKKLDALGPPLIRTVRGVGYTLRPAAAVDLDSGR